MKTTTAPLDVAVIGAGPAGLQAGFNLAQAGLNVQVLERGPAVGSFFRKFPRRRNLISINKVHTGLSAPEARLRYDWNSLLGGDTPLFTTYSPKYFPSADTYVAYLEHFAAQLQDRIETSVDITGISRDASGLFTLTEASGAERHARQVIIATGVTLPWLPDGVEGLEHIDLYQTYDSTPERYRGKRVLILGKGNSAFETAESLIDEAQAIHVMSPNPIKFAWNTHFVGHLRAVNTNFLDTYQLKSQNAVLDATPVRIEKRGTEFLVTAQMQAAKGHEIVLSYDHVIGCTGFRFDAGILDAAIRPEMQHMGKFPVMGANWECPTAPGLWFAGTIMQSRDFKKTMSGFVHGFRHNIAALTQFVTARATGAPLPTDTVPTEASALALWLQERFSLSAALFLQPGFLADVIALDGSGRRHAAVPYAWAQDGVLRQGDHLTATLEFGDFGANPMHVDRQHTAFGGAPDPYIHPVLRHWRDGQIVAQMHLSDHLDADWRSTRDPGHGTVQAMTYADQGATLPPCDVALRQITTFLQEVGVPDVARTAAE